jgi:uridine kinase
MEENPIALTTPRNTVELHFPDGRVITGPRGSSLEKFLSILPDEEASTIVGAIVNNALRELTYSVDIDSRVEMIHTDSEDGARIYRRSLTFLLEVAFERIYPGMELRIDHSVSSGGFFCQIAGCPQFGENDLERLRVEMNDLIQRDIPFIRNTVPLQEAIDYFSSQGEDEKVKLIRYRQKDTMVLYSLLGHRDYHHGYMVPSTRYLKVYALSVMGDGFVLNYPRRFAPNEIQPLPDSPKLLNTFRLYGNWLDRLGINNVAALNDSIAAGRIREVILISEALHEQRIAEIAKQISENIERIQVVLISGPSSSGKTTFSKRLSVQLLSQGVSPFPLEMDNYFVDRDKTPRSKNGELDYEALQALNLPLLNQHVAELVKGNEVQLPHYDFKKGKSGAGEKARLQPGQLLILEGIHGLNPELLPGFPSERAYRVYVSALTQLNLDKHNRISTTDTRLMRRIVRDAAERGYSAWQTLQRWDSVRAGEKTHIFPYQENADTMFNSALVYELSALKPVVEPLLRQVPYGTKEYIEAKRLLAFLEWFLPITSDMIPDNSILREFLGGSILKDFQVWHNGKE